MSMTAPIEKSPVLFWCQWEQTGNLFERLKAEAPDCEVRRVQFAPGGADVRDL